MTESALNGNWNAWADIVIRIWRQKVIRNNIGAYKNRKNNSENLFASFERHVMNASAGNEQKIEFLFKEYGIFVDMGVGKGTPKGNSGNVKTKRKRKEWYSEVWYSEVMKLREHMAIQIGDAAANRIIFGMQTTINGSMGNNSKYDAKYAAYREKDLARNALNRTKRNQIIK